MDKLKGQQAVKKTLDGRQKELPKEAPKDKPPETEDRTQTVKFCICEVGRSHVPMLTGSTRVDWQNLTKTPILKGEEKGIAFACAKQIASDFIRAQPESDDGPPVQYFQDSAVFALQPRRVPLPEVEAAPRPLGFSRRSNSRTAVSVCGIQSAICTVLLDSSRCLFTPDRTGALLAEGQGECRRDSRCVPLNSGLGIIVISPDFILSEEIVLL